MKRKLRSTLLIATMFSLFVSCGSDEAVMQQSTSQTIMLQREPEMVRFERSLAGMGAKYSSDDQAISREARDKVTASALTYLSYYGEKVKENASDEEILALAFNLHAKNIQRLKIQTP